MCIVVIEIYTTPKWQYGRLMNLELPSFKKTVAMFLLLKHCGYLGTAQLGC